MRLILLSFLVLAATVRAEGKGGDDSKWKEAEQAYKDDIKKKQVRYKKRAIEALPANDERTIAFIIDQEKLLSSKDWWIRTTAAEQLSKIRLPELREKLLSYAKHSDLKVREGVLAALALSTDARLDPPVIVEALKDKAWEVRRMACWAAGQQRIKEAVEPMIAMINSIDPRTGREIQKGEQHPRVHPVLLFNLEEIVGTSFHTDAAQWRDYWDRNKDKALPRVKRFDVESFADVKVEFNDTFARKGTGPLTLVLPMPGKSTVYYMPYFSQWMFVKWLFVNLPPITSFPDVKKNEHGDPIYPVDILVDAFEAIRKKYSVEQMVVVGHWFSTWVAAKYAQKYPDRVMGLVLIDPYASNEGYRKAIDSAKRSGDPDSEFWAKVSSYEIKIASTLEGEVYDYVRTTAFLAQKNRDDLEVGILRTVWHDPAATDIAIPDFDIRGEDTSRIPALIFLPGKENEMMAFDDLSKLQRYYPKNVTVKGGKDFAYLPFMEAPEKFEEGLRLFVDKKVIEQPAAAPTKTGDANK
jgi:pimeloyl-ACP methyl ester carboxylesterase